MPSVEANGIRFEYLEQGDGPLVLLLHGFPDLATTFSHQMPALAGAGYRAVAPYLRGYPPSEVPADGFFDPASIVADLIALIESLGAPAYVVGHDWGAFAVYGLCAARPDLVRKAVTMALPHPMSMAQAFTSFEQIRLSFYIWFFQLPGLPEAALADGSFIRRLWRDWSPGHAGDDEHIDDVVRTITDPAALPAAIGYYRALFDPAKGDPSLADLRAATARPIEVPTLVLMGEDDGCIAPGVVGDASFVFTGDYRSETLAGCGHFLHRERPDEITKRILDWLT